jgi:SAM-dependent methyltransferase
MTIKEINWTDEKIKGFWDYEAQFPEYYFTFNYGKNIIKYLSAYLKNINNCLDYGSGPGFLIPHLFEKKIDVSAVEFSLNGVSLLNKKFKNEAFFNGAFQSCELVKQNKKFDLIFCIELIEHLNDSTLDNVLNNFKLLSNSNGTIIISTPNEELLSNGMIHCPECDTVFHRWQHIRSWSKQSLSDFLIKNGFEIIDIHATDFSNNILPPKTRIRKLLEFTKYKLLFQKRIPDNYKYPHLLAIIKKQNECVE